MNTKIKSLTWLFDNHPYITIIGLGVLLRLIIFILYQHINIYPDSHAYIYLAEKLSTFSLKGYIGIRTPGYPLLLMLSSINMTIVVILQNVIGIITSVFLFKILFLINFNKRYALTFTLMSVVYLPSIFFEYSILSESLTLFNIILIFYFLFGIIYSERTGLLNFIILSLLISFLVIIKPFYIFIPFVIVFVLLLYKRDRRSVIRNYSILLILPLFVLAGWCSINYQNTGHFTPTTLDGYNLAQNCVSFAENTDARYKEIGDIYAKHRKENQDNDKDISMSIWDSYKELKTATNLSFVDLSQLLYDYSLSTIRLNPLKYFKQVGISWLDFWKTSLYWQYDSFAIDNANNILNVICYVERILLQILKIIFVLFIPYNLLKYRISNKYISPQFIISVVVLLTSILQALSTYGTNSRFSYPFEILIAVSAVMNMYALWKSMKRIP